MPDYLDVPIETNPEALAEESYAYLQDQIPGWVPAEANLETIVIDANSRQTAVNRDLASRVPRIIFASYGKIVSINPVQATKAVAQTTWTAINNLGYTIPAGTVVAFREGGDVLHEFEVLTDVVIPPGSVATAAGAVTIIAVEIGSVANDLGVAGHPIELVNPLDWVVGIVMTGATSGGVDAEGEVDYLNRLADRLSIIAPRPILAKDFATMARTTEGANVGRALGIDGYDPASGGSYGNDRMVSVACIHDDGTACTSPEKTLVDNELEGVREVNFIVNIIDPTYTPIDINYTVTAEPGFISADIQTRVLAALTNYLSSANWGKGNAGTNFGITTEWLAKSTVRYNDIIWLIRDVIGVAHVDDVTMRKGVAAFARIDIALTGAAPLTQVGVVTPTIVIP